MLLERNQPLSFCSARFQEKQESHNWSSYCRNRAAENQMFFFLHLVAHFCSHGERKASTTEAVAAPCSRLEPSFLTLKSLSSSAGEGNDSSQKELVQVIVNGAQRQWDWALSLAGRSNAQQTAVQVPLTVYHKNTVEKKDEDSGQGGLIIIMN